MLIKCNVYFCLFYLLVGHSASYRMPGVCADLPRRCERYLKPLTCRMQDAVYVSLLPGGDGGQVHAASVTRLCCQIIIDSIAAHSALKC